MIRYECDKCGRRLDADDPHHFIVKIEVYAAATPLDISPDDLARDHGEEIRRLIQQMSEADPDEIEDRTYRRFRFDLCGECQRAFLTAPLGKR